MTHQPTIDTASPGAPDVSLIEAVVALTDMIRSSGVIIDLSKLDRSRMVAAALAALEGTDPRRLDDPATLRNALRHAMNLLKPDQDPSGELPNTLRLKAMQDAADAFYSRAMNVGNHPFIEFAGLMNEYIKCCHWAHANGVDFTRCNTHTGQPLPMADFQVNYVNEKLECIFTGRAVLSSEPMAVPAEHPIPST